MSDFITAATATLRTLVQDVATNGAPTTKHGVTITTSGRFMTEGKRIGMDRAIELIAEDMVASASTDIAVAEGPRQPKRTGFTFDSLNAATQAVFYRLAEDIQTATLDGDQTCSVRLGHDIPKINLVDAPRITNLKKAGLLETFEGIKKSYRMIRLTDAGRAIWFAHVG